MEKFFPEESDDEHGDMWLVNYDDGDAEHFDAAEVGRGRFFFCIAIDVHILSFRFWSLVVLALVTYRAAWSWFGGMVTMYLYFTRTRLEGMRCSGRE